jgi:hypothetical protein
MRWYIKDYTIAKLTERISKIESNALTKKSVVTMSLISEEEGHYCIQNDSLYRIHYDSKFTHFFFNDIQLICQHSDPIKEEIMSRIPVNWLCFTNTTMKYTIDKDPRILLCIEYHDANVFDFYFEVEVRTADKSLIELINDSKKEINGFLLMLN